MVIPWMVATTRLSRPRTPHTRASLRSVERVGDALAVLGLALGLRLAFSLLMAGTFDNDEFVYLALGRQVAQGAVPYRDFAFFHPPGILAVLAALNPLTALWWPLVRLADAVIDSLTAVLVWRAGRHLFDRRTALAAGVLYAVNPVALVAAVRVDQEAPMMALGMAALVILLTTRSRPAALVAGACLAAACWIKYPMVLYLPLAALAARRSLIPVVAGFTAATIALFAPYAGELHPLYNDTIRWQLVGRYPTPISLRLLTAGIFWVLVNPFAVVGLVRRQAPLWVILGYLSGAVFLIPANTYPHYFMLAAPFAALLGAPAAARLVRLPRAVLVGACLALLGLWRVGVAALSGQPAFIPANTFAATVPAVRLIDRVTPPGTPMVSDQMQYSYLAHRPEIDQYFWDAPTLVSARRLEHGLTSRSVAVLAGAWYYFPPGLMAYLDAHGTHRYLGQTQVWLLARPPHR